MFGGRAPRRSRNTSIDQLELSIPKIENSKLIIYDMILGRSHQGIVRKGMYGNKIVAVKTVQTQNNDVKLMLRENKLLNIVNHEHIVSILAVCPNPDEFHIVMEYFESYTLQDLIFRKDVRNQCVHFHMHKNKNYILSQVCQGLHFLHSRRSPIIHRDVKPANILVNWNYQTKLCDFDMGVYSGFDESLKSSYMPGFQLRGTILYMSPEMLLRNKPASKASDVWAFACTVVEIYNEKKVWYVKPNTNVHDLLIDLFRGRRIPSMNQIPWYLTQLVQECFRYDKKSRPDINEFIDILDRCY